jgi:hypothetical protein
MRAHFSNRQRRFRVAAGVYFSPATEQGCIVLNLERGTILSLNDSGALMLSKLAGEERGLTREELIETVRREFEDVEVFRVENAVDALLVQLEKTGILDAGQTGSTRRRDVRGELARRVPLCVRHVLSPLLFLKAYTFAALVLLFTAEVVRKLGGFRSIHRSVEQWDTGVRSPSDETALLRACAAVNRACTWHPKRALCLQRASVLVCLLRSLGFPAEMVIGVHKMPFYGHAWAEVGGKVVNDHANAQKFFHVLNRC